ncbi:MAG TPA: hypothetical protein VHD62_06300 [Opitutaceae bacterium]|nr:hypothetical protein [Opitutaceae bacterium]
MNFSLGGERDPVEPGKGKTFEHGQRCRAIRAAECTFFSNEAAIWNSESFRSRLRSKKLLRLRKLWLPGPDGNTNFREAHRLAVGFARLAVGVFARLAECVEAFRIARNKRFFLSPRPSLQLSLAGTSFGEIGVDFEPEE